MPPLNIESLSSSILSCIFAPLFGQAHFAATSSFPMAADGQSSGNLQVLSSASFLSRPTAGALQVRTGQTGRGEALAGDLLWPQKPGQLVCFMPAPRPHQMQAVTRAVILSKHSAL